LVKSERLAEEERQREEEAAALALSRKRNAKLKKPPTHDVKLVNESVNKLWRRHAFSTSEKKRPKPVDRRVAEKAGFQRKPPAAPAATAVKAPAPAPTKYRLPIARGGGGWRAKLEAKQAAAGGGGSLDGAAPAVVASPAQASVPLKEESKLDEDGFQTVPVRGAKKVWRFRRGRA
jgi:translation initiation factor 3 subunit A